MTEEYGNIPDGFLLNPEEIQELRKQKYGFFSKVAIAYK